MGLRTTLKHSLKRENDPTPNIHQALCESKVDCSVAGAASDLPGLFVSHARSVLVTALQRLAGLAYQVNLTLLTAIIALYLPSPAEPSLLEFGESDLHHHCLQILTP